MDNEKILLKENLELYLKNNDSDKIIDDLLKTNSNEFIQLLKKIQPNHSYKNNLLNFFFKYEDNLCLEEMLLMRSLSQALEKNNSIFAHHYISDEDYELIGDDGLNFVISLLKDDFDAKIILPNEANTFTDPVEVKIFKKQEKKTF